MANKSDDTYIIQGDEELERMYASLHYPKFPPLERSIAELEEEEDEGEGLTPAAQASSEDE